MGIGEFGGALLHQLVFHLLLIDLGVDVVEDGFGGQAVERFGCRFC